MARNATQVQETSPGVWLLVMFSQDHIFCNGKLFDHAIAHAFFRDIGEHSISQITRSKISNIIPFEANSTSSYFSQTGDCLRQFTLTVPRDTCNSQDLA